MELSIIIPAYNSETSISECLNSVLNEKYSDRYEIIVINDGSTDSTKAICEKYQSIYDNITLINKENGGVSSARNAGLDSTKGRYIMFVDSDDRVEKNCIEYIFERLDQIGDLMIFGYDMVNKDGEHTHIHNIYSSVDYDLIFREIVAQRMNAPFGKLFRNDIIQEHNIRFDRDISLGEDFEFLLRYYVHTKNANSWNKVLYHYYYTENSLSNKKLSISNINDYCKAYECEIRTLESSENHKYTYMLKESYVRVLFRKLFISRNIFRNINLFRTNFDRNALINDIFFEKYPLKTQVKKFFLKMLLIEKSRQKPTRF